jgi:hypothetical protein
MKLPLVHDIISRGGQVAAADDWLIFTNVDITPLPHFYLFLAELLRRGVDGLVVNRRTISKSYADVKQLPLAFSELGETHPGLDCFVFPRSRLASLPLTDSIVGIPRVMLPLAFWLIATSERPVFAVDAHATAHIGNDRPWLTGELDDYREHNLREARTALAALREDPVHKERLERFAAQNPDAWFVPKWLAPPSPPRTARRRRLRPRIAHALRDASDWLDPS